MLLAKKIEKLIVPASIPGTGLVVLEVNTYVQLLPGVSGKVALTQVELTVSSVKMELKVLEI